MRLIVFFIILLTPTICFAQRTKGCTKPLNEKYSFKDFFNQSFLLVDPSEFNNTCIKGSSFFQDADIDTPKQSVEKAIFPNGMTGVEFVRCNLDNVLIPLGNTVDVKSSRRRIKVQNDMEDWILDVSGNPIEPTNREKFLGLGESIDPKDIPLVRMSEPKTNKAEVEKRDAILASP